MKIRCVKCGSKKYYPHLKSISPNMVCSCGGTYVEDAREPVNMLRCGTCAIFNNESGEKCQNCNGTGKVVIADVDIGVGTEKYYGPCGVCHGSGRLRGCDTDDPNCVVQDLSCYVSKKSKKGETE